jgi:hypothetical protein
MTFQSVLHAWVRTLTALACMTPAASGSIPPLRTLALRPPSKSGRGPRGRCARHRGGRTYNPCGGLDHVGASTPKPLTRPRSPKPSNRFANSRMPLDELRRHRDRWQGVLVTQQPAKRAVNTVPCPKHRGEMLWLAPACAPNARPAPAWLQVTRGRRAGDSHVESERGGRPR